MNERLILSQAMSRNRFEEICKCLRSDMTRVTPERDKLVAIRDIHDKFAARCRAAYKSGINVCVDECFSVGEI